MRLVSGSLGVLLLAWCASASARADGGAFQGEWRTSIGIVNFTQQGDDVSGTYGNAGQFTIKGKVTDGKVLTFEYKEGNVQGDARFTLDDSGRAFTGGFQVRGGRGGPWNGWRADPEAPKASLGKFGGLWLTSLGLMELAQDGDKAKGRYALRGASDIDGTVTGRRYEFRFRAFQGGQGWFDLADDGLSIAGAAHSDGSAAWFAWRGRPAPEFPRHVPLVAGKVVDGSTKGLLTYCIRAPEKYDERSKTTWPVVLILHGSNMNARSYVETIAAAWPDIARDFILLGINGELPSALGPDAPRFNYSYVNFVGKSTFGGFPGTDRESPALVAEAVAELKSVYPIARYFVGGHSQGGFLAYSLLMNYPEAFAGAFPVSSGVIFQCEPGAYADEALKQKQRRVPLAIVHGKTDPVVDFGMGQYAAELFGDAGWPAFRFFTSNDAGHMFARLPIGEAIRWLEAQSSEDASRLVAVAAERLKDGGYRDAIAALNRAKALELRAPEEMKKEMLRLASAIDAKANPEAAKLLEKMRSGTPGWIEEFLAFRDQFQFADSSRELMTAFDALRAQHEEPAKKTLGEARQAFQQGRADDGYAKYQELVDTHPASSLYRPVKRWLAERK